AAHVFLDLDEDLLVGEAADGALRESRLEIGGDAFCEGAVGVPSDQLHRAGTGAEGLSRGFAEGVARRSCINATPLVATGRGWSDPRPVGERVDGLARGILDHVELDRGPRIDRTRLRRLLAGEAVDAAAGSVEHV